MASAEGATAWRGFEARTHDGELMKFWAPANLTPQQRGWVRAAIGLTKGYTLPGTHRVNVQHGCYGRYSRYDIEQTKYAGGRAGYIEAIHVRDAVDGRCAHIVYRFNTYGGSVFWEFNDQTSADKAWRKCWGKARGIDEAMREQPGFIREVFCDVMTPWFYAVGNQELVGDWAFPEYQQAHPYFVPGKLYVVKDESGEERVKRCIGSRVTDRQPVHDLRIPADAVTVYWDDGTHFSSELGDQWWARAPDQAPLPRALAEAEDDVSRSIGAFRELLAKEPELAKHILGELKRHRDQRPELF